MRKCVPPPEPSPPSRRLPRPPPASTQRDSMSKRHDRLARYLGGLYAYAVSLCRDRDEARDLVQGCAEKALSARNVPGDDAAYRAWLFRILRNHFIDQKRAAVELDRLDEDSATPAMDRWQYEESLVNTLTVRRGIDRLRLEHREVLALVDMAGFTYAEAAALIEVPVGTVMSRLSRARRALLARIASDNLRSLPRRAVGEEQ